MNHWLTWALLSAVFAAITAIAAKGGVDKLDSDYATLLRTMAIAALLGVFVLVAGKWQNPLRVSPRALGWLAVSALGTGASWFCYFRALKLGEASRVAAVDKLSVLLVAIFAVLMLHERLSLLQWLGIALAAVGIALVGWKA